MVLNRSCLNVGPTPIARKRHPGCKPLTALAGALQAQGTGAPRRKRVVPRYTGGRLRADSVQSLLARHVRVASERVPVIGVQADIAARAQAQRCDGALQAGVDCPAIANCAVARS